MDRRDGTVTLILPEHKKNKNRMLIGALGLFLRWALALTGSFAMTGFILSGANLPIPDGYVFLTALILCAVFSVMTVSMTAAGVMSASTLALSIIGLSLFGKPWDVLRYSAVALRNAWYVKLCELGYNYGDKTVSVTELAESAGCTEGELYTVIMCLTAALICAFFVFFTVKRARIVPILSMYALLATVSVYFEVISDVGIFGLLTAAVLAHTALAFYDSVFANKQSAAVVLETDMRSAEAKKELALTVYEGTCRGGYVGVAAFILFMSVIAVPVGLNRSMIDIPAVSQPIIRIERYISALVNGHEPGKAGILSLFGDELDGHSTKAKKAAPSGRELLTVGSDAAVPVYLKTWTGTDYAGDKWYTLSYGRRDDFVGEFGEDFSSDALFFEMRAAVDERLAAVPEIGKVMINSPLGYVTSRVDIKKASAANAEVVLPSVQRQDCGIMRYGTYEPHFIDYINYFDGVYAGSSFALSDSYSVIADIPMAADSTFAYNISMFVGHYSEQFSVIKDVRKLLSEGASEDEIRAYYEGLDTGSTIVSDAYRALPNAYDFPEGEMTLGYRYVYNMGPEERAEIDRLCDTLAAYNDNVYKGYVTLCEEYERFYDLMGQIADENGFRFRTEAATYSGRHRAVTAVIDYLSKNMTYTLSPKEADTSLPYHNAVHTFLFDTKEGYCTQYATAATMLLRSVGIPVRYVEGYIAKDFEPSQDGTAGYICSVTDFERHAWIEVYFDYYGWVRYEATAPYLGAVQLPAGDIQHTDVAESEFAPAEPNESDESVETETHSTVYVPGTEGEERADKKSVLTVPVVILGVITAAVFTVVCIYIYYLKKRSWTYFDTVQRLHMVASSTTASQKQRLDTARKMGDIIAKILLYHSLTPFSGETATAFSERVDGALMSLTEISCREAILAVQKAEFSTDITQTELALISEYLKKLSDGTISGAGWLDRVKLKYFILVS